MNIYVNSKEPLSQEESDYAELWLRTSRPFPASILTLKKRDENFEEEEGDKNEKERGKDDKWEPLDNLPPPYPNNPNICRISFLVCGGLKDRIPDILSGSSFFLKVLISFL